MGKARHEPIQKQREEVKHQAEERSSAAQPSMLGHRAPSPAKQRSKPLRKSVCELRWKFQADRKRIDFSLRTASCYHGNTSALLHRERVYLAHSSGKSAPGPSGHVSLFSAKTPHCGRNIQEINHSPHQTKAKRRGRRTWAPEDPLISTIWCQLPKFLSPPSIPQETQR